jgi:rhamnogalacturonyl hydrolase YesR
MRSYSIHLSVATCLAIGLSFSAAASRAEQPPVDPAQRSLEAALAADPLVPKVLHAVLVMQRESWEEGVLAQYFVEAGDQDMIVATGRAMLVHSDRNGRVAAIGGSAVDPLMGGEALFRAAQISRDPMIVKAQEKLLAFARTGAVRTKDGIVCHNADKTIWADTANTAAPYLAVTGNPADAVRQIQGVFAKLWDPKRKLLVHIWNEDQKRWSDPSGWASGNGWFCAATMRVIRALPPEMQKEKSDLAALLKQVLDGVISRQRPDGSFPNTLDKPDSFAEVAAAEMIAFSIYESVRGGWLPRSYLVAADKMRAAARAKVDRYGFVQDVCGAPEFNAPGISPEAQAFFLMMEVAAKKLEASAAKP